MAFDFPASPTIGQVSNGFVYNGMGWSGNPATTGPQTEQFFDLSGKTELIVDVPSWAKVAVFEGAIFPASATNYGLMSVSVDGLAFYGNVHQLSGGPFHKVVGGYGTQGAVTATGFYLGMPATNANVPQTFNATVNVETGLANQLISCRSEFMSFDNTALATQYCWQGYLNATPSPSPCRVKKFRIFAAAATAFAATSYVKVRWLGEAASIPQSNAIPDSPSDGGEYVRVNGIWRLKSQSYTLDGLGYVDVQVPPTARTARIAASARITSGYVAMRWSGDGVNFLAGASDYTYMGPYHYSGGTGSYGNQTSVNNTFVPITPYADNAAIFHHSHALMALQKNGGVFTLDYHGTSYNNAAAQTGLHYDWLAYSNSTFGGVNTLKALRFYPTVGVFTTGIVHLDWMY